MEPMNYITNVKAPFESVIQGVQLGSAINAQQQAQQLQQQQQAQRLQMQQDLTSLANNQNAGAKDYAAMMTKYPQLSEQFKRSWDVLNADQQQNNLKQSTQVYSALQTGNNDVAIDLLNKQADALKNSGKPEEAQHYNVMAKLIEMRPEVAKTTAALGLSAIMGPDKFASTFATLGDQNRAADKAPGELAKTQEEVTASEAKRKIDILDTQIKQANSETQRGQLQLERDKLTNEMQLKGQAAGDDKQSNIESVQRALDTTKALLEDPLLNSSVGIGSSIGKVLSWIPGTENKDYRAKIETLKAQLFLPAVAQMKGMGALSDAEGRKLDAAIASLDSDQSPKAFKNNLGVVQNIMSKSQRKLLANPNLPTKAGAGGFVLTHPTYGNVTENDVNRMMTQHPGTTRDQVMQYLTSTGGKTPNVGASGGY